MGIADWAANRQAELIKLLGLQRQSRPNHNTYRRILAYTLYEDEIERLVGKYNQEGEHGDVYAVDGKAIRGMRKKDESISEYVLSVCDVKQGKVMSQVQVGRKENEITKAPEALKLVKIAGKVVTGDAMHTQKRLSTQILYFPSKKIKADCTKVFRNCLPLNIQDRASEKSRLISRPLKK